MSEDVATKWNGRYSAEGVQWQASPPRDLLLSFADRLPGSGLVLDAAAGVGVNGLVLARRGLHVVCLDVSEVGLRLAREQARRESLWLETAVYDLSRPWFPPDCFDVILNFRFLERATFPMYRRALKPGGWLLFETFVRTPETHTDVDFYLLPGELTAAFADFDLLHDGEITGVNGRSGQPKSIAQLVARKPGDLGFEIRD